jgi:hypothetical protein
VSEDKIRVATKYCSNIDASHSTLATDLDALSRPLLRYWLPSQACRTQPSSKIRSGRNGFTGTGKSGQGNYSRGTQEAKKFAMLWYVG